MSAPPKLIIESFLTEEERLSSTWQSVRQHLERMLAKKRVQNDNPKLTDVETATLRGHIECLRAILALGAKPPETVAPVARLGSRPDLGAKYG